MARKPKPRWNWEHTHDGNDMARREKNLDFDWLAARIGEGLIPGIPTTEQSVQTILWEFYNSHFDDCGPNFEEVRAAHNEILEAAEVLSSKVAQLDWLSHTWLQGGFYELEKAAKSKLGKKRVRKISKLFVRHSSSRKDARIMHAVDILRESISKLDYPIEKKTRGPKPKRTIKRLIGCIAYLIEEQSGIDALNGFHHDAITERYEGRLVQILEHIFDRFAPDLNMTNSAIGGQIRRTIGDMSA